MGPFHLSLLRILVKNGHYMELSTLLQGFPDSSEDYVLKAVSDLISRGLVVESHSGKYVSVAQSRRKEALHIVQSAIMKVEEPIAKTDLLPEKRAQQKGLRPLLLASGRVGTVALASIIILALLVTVGSTISSTSSETSLVAYTGHQNGPLFVIIEGSNVTDSSTAGYSTTVYIIHECGPVSGSLRD